MMCRSVMRCVLALTLAPFFCRAAAETVSEAERSVVANLEKMPRPWKVPGYRPAPLEENYHNLDHTSHTSLVDWPTYMAALEVWGERDCVRVSVIGETLEKYPIHLVNITDFSVPEREKFTVFMTSHHGGSEHSGFTSTLAGIDFLASDAAAVYRRKFNFYVIPCGNIRGYFCNGSNTNAAGIDPYSANGWDAKKLALRSPEKTPELVAFKKVIDDTLPEIVIDNHGVDRWVDGGRMIQFVGGSAYNQALMPWSGALVGRINEELAKSGSTGFRYDEDEMQRFRSAGALASAYPARIRPNSHDLFMTDMYPGVRWHSMPLILETGHEDMVPAALAALCEFGLNPPAELRGGLPVDHIITDWSGGILHSYGTTPGERRRSRVELWNLQEKITSGVLTPIQEYRMARVWCFGKKGIEVFSGKPVSFFRVSQGQTLADRKDDGDLCWSAIRRFLRLGPEKFFSCYPAADALADCPAPQNGVTFAMELQVPPDRHVEMLDVRLNGSPLKEDPRDGWELVRHRFGQRLFVHVPPEKSRRLHCYLVTAAYGGDMKPVTRWQPSEEMKKRKGKFPKLTPPGK